MRIRTIKPDFWTHPKTIAVSRDARLLFIGLLNDADDEGRLHGSAKRLAGLLFPGDADVDGPTIARWLDELETARLVSRYRVASADFIHVLGFRQHQKIDRRTASRLPEPIHANLGEPAHKSVEPPDLPVKSAEMLGLEGDLGRGKGSGRGEGSGKQEAPSLPEPVQEPHMTSKALEDARALVVRANHDARNAKRAAAEAIYDRPQSPDALLAHVGTDGLTIEVTLASRFPLFDGKDGRPFLVEVVATLWPAFQGHTWPPGGRDALRWLVRRMAEDHQKLRQSEHIIGEKKAKGITLPAENEARAEAAPDQAAEMARYQAAYAAHTGESFPTFAKWKAMGSPQTLAEARSAPEAPPSTIDMLPEPTAQEAKAKTEALAALARLADGFKPAAPAPRRLRLAQGSAE